ncbi:MAG: hypothetical protein FJ216_03970 [Ignavibacteria bacterium]|nr:hypothetical protein [Ignavibacteria bacterium]
MKKYISIAVIILLAVVFLFSCGKKKWGSDEKDAYLKTCIDAAKGTMGEAKAKAYCDCSLKYIMDKYPYVEDSQNLTAEDLDKIIEDCMK